MAFFLKKIDVDSRAEPEKVRARYQLLDRFYIKK
jgi:hypothetical protein